MTLEKDNDNQFTISINRATLVIGAIMAILAIASPALVMVYNQGRQSEKIDMLTTEIKELKTRVEKNMIGRYHDTDAQRDLTAIRTEHAKDVAILTNLITKTTDRIDRIESRIRELEIKVK
jgi:hypothetical protein